MPKLFPDHHARDGDEEPFRAALPAFDVRVIECPRLRVVEVDGDVDILTVPKLQAAVRDDGRFDALILDLGEVSFISSTGLGLIASLHQRLSRRGGGLALVAVRRHVAALLELTGLAEAVLVAADIQTALRLLAQPET